MFNFISMGFKYLFILIIYAFIISIVRLIYLDISTSNERDTGVYLKLLNLKNDFDFKLKEHYFIDESLSIGRTKRNNLVIPDKYISKEHAVIYRDNDRYLIEDLDSSNGTFVNNELISEPTVLNARDYIRVGNVEFIFMINED